MPPVVLLGEHEPEVAELARRYLVRAGLAVTVATNADETIEALGEHSAAAAVLDLTMPGLDARRVRRLLGPRGRPRTATAPPGTLRDPSPGVCPTAPVYLLGSGMRPRDVRVSADVCLHRPFSPRLLVSRVLAALAPSVPPAAPSVPQAYISPIALGSTAQPAENSAAPWPALIPAVRLTPAESALLSAFVAQAGRVLTRDQLRAAMSSSGRPSSDRAVDVHIGQLRAKLPAPGLIRTVRGVGYILDGPRDSRPGTAPARGNMRDASR